MKITGMSVLDVRFPTSRQLDGSDAMNPDPDYSAAYVILHTESPPPSRSDFLPTVDQLDPTRGHGLAFTIGRGTEIVVSAIESLRPLVVGASLAEFADNPGRFWRRLTGDSQLRWIGPEKGAIHLATAAVANALWDLYAKSQNLPLWRLIAGFTPEERVRAVDFRYLTDALTPEEAIDRQKSLHGSKAARFAQLEQNGYPAYTTSAGWLGYSDEKLRHLCEEAIRNGWTHLKIKVGRDLADDLRRCRIIREVIGPDRKLMVDANQVWDVPQAIAWMEKLAPFRPWWIEEPTSPDDVLGHAEIARAMAPHGIGVATGEHGMNRVLFKQLLQARAIQFCQIDACRLGGVNEVLAVQMLAEKFGVPVCPHAGGVGLCEHVQHLSMIDFVAISGSAEGRVIEYVDHLHEHFVDPVRMRGYSYQPPQLPGYSTQMKASSLAEYQFPNGPVWRSIRNG